MKNKWGIMIAVLTSLLVITCQAREIVNQTEGGEKPTREITFQIEGMETPCCAQKLKNALLEVKGVKQVLVCHERGIAKVELETETVTNEQLIKVIEEAGFKGRVKEGAGEPQGLMKRFEVKFKHLDSKYNLSQKDIEQHWLEVKNQAAKVYQRCCEWSRERGMELEDAELYCQSAILSALGKEVLAEELFQDLLPMTDEAIKKEVRKRYDNFAREGGYSCPIMDNLAGYSPEEVALVPKISRELSRGCGNPTSFAELKPGEVVLDLGCGGGTDIILASHKVAPGGRVIGIDFAPEMIKMANQAIKEAGLENAEVRLGDIEHLEEIPDNSADVIISNCVICLVPDKKAVYQEAFRILKPGGRLAISDIVQTGQIEPGLKKRLASVWQGPFGGTWEEKKYLNLVREVGFKKIKPVMRHLLTQKELTKMATCPGEELIPPVTKQDIAKLEGKIISLKFTAIKPN